MAISFHNPAVDIEFGDNGHNHGATQDGIAGLQFQMPVVIVLILRQLYLAQSCMIDMFYTLLFIGETMHSLFKEKVLR